jgi:hypothetical protein
MADRSSATPLMIFSPYPILVTRNDSSNVIMGEFSIRAIQLIWYSL